MAKPGKLAGSYIQSQVMSVPTKAQWQAIKTQYGIPDGLSSIKMGDRFDWWVKTEGALRTKRDYAGCLTNIETLVKDLATYAKALKAAEPKKFKGKTLPEQTTNYKAANEKFKEIFGTVSDAKNNYVSLSKPLLGVQLSLAKAETALKKLNKQSTKDQFASFYKEEFRGINLPLQMLDKVNEDPGIKRGIIGFKSHATMLDKMLASGGGFNGAEAFGTATTALALLGSEVGGKK